MPKPHPRSAKLWDKYSIKAEIHRRGQTLEGLGRTVDISGSYMRRALRSPCRTANICIAQFLSVPLHELWPNWFYPDGGLIPAQHRKRLSRQRQSLASHESPRLAVGA